MTITEKILLEAAMPTEYMFDTVMPNRYAFIMRDMTKFPEPADKWAVVKELEGYRKNSGKGLPIETLNPQMFIATQNSVDSDNIKQIAKNRKNISDIPFVVKFHGIYYLLDGHHRTTVALVTKDQYIKCHVYDLDTCTIGLDRQTNYGNQIKA